MIEIRDAVESDVAALVALLEGGALTAREDPSDLRPYTAALARILADPDDTVLVAVEDGTVVGMCQLVVLQHLQERGGRCAEVESMHVAEGRRAGGVGGSLLEAAVARAVAAGCYRVQLTSNVARVDAQRFYRAHAFEPTHTGLKRYLR